MWLKVCAKPPADQEKGGAKHTFKNTGTVAAAIVEVFGKTAAATPGPDGAALALAMALAEQRHQGHQKGLLN